MGLLDGQTAIITGAASPGGIGLATARLFAAEGAKVAVLDLPAKKPEEVAKSLGPEHIGLSCDVRSKPDCLTAVAKVLEAFGSVDSLVGNAGIVRGTPFLEIGEEEYEDVLSVNLKGNFNMSQVVLPHMRKRDSGSIILMSSIAGQVGGGLFGSSHYASAKSGLFGLAKALARESAADGVRVNAIAPGVIDNDFTQGKMTRKIKNEIAAKVPMGRLGTSEDVAKVCLFLASDLSAYMTGVVLPVNGGLLIS